MKDYRFILPNLQKKLIGTQGEQAQFIPYRQEEDITADSILRELRRQPHMAELAEKLDAGRRLYLLGSPGAEQLFLAAEYIANWHHLVNGLDTCCTAESDADESEEEDEEDSWRNGDVNLREFDFDTGIPFLLEDELTRFYRPEDGFGFGNSLYRPDLTSQKRPWWAMSDSAPLVVSLVNPDLPFSLPLSGLPRLLENLKERSLVIVLCLCQESEPDRTEDLDFFSPGMSMEDVSFELETDCIRLGAPDQESRYKQDVLRQLAREKNAPLAPRVSALRLLSLIEEHRGDVDNRTIAKAVSNALLRRKAQGPLRERDFDYLSAVFPKRGKRPEKADAQKLVGQPEIRRQLTRVLDSMTFQQRRKAQGLPCSPLHYTFAFMGAPGTGKTSWARWLAAEMERRGLLQGAASSICINAAELKAKYVGHTTGKVKALFQQYQVIILDEAYSLAEGEGDDSFAREALAQLCVELEDHAEDRLVVFAGYGGAKNPGDNRMLRFLQSNPGINSRVAFKLYFPDFRPRELTEVLRSMLERERYVLPEEAEARAADFFRLRAENRAFGNCREARNLADRIKLQLAARLAGNADCPKEALSQICLQDVEDAVSEILEEYRALERDGGQAIGFSSGRSAVC